jgi:hypothetical protein
MEIGVQLTIRGKELNILRYLYDLRNAPNIESVTSNYEFAYKEMPKSPLDANATVALLADPEDRSHDFVETVMRNAGFNVRLFSEKEEAVAWLEKGAGR